jgi:hypothetical protein
VAVVLLPLPALAAAYGLGADDLALIDEWFAQRSLVVSEEDGEESEVEELAEEGVE